MTPTIIISQNGISGNRAQVVIDATSANRVATAADAVRTAADVVLSTAAAASAQTNANRIDLGYLDQAVVNASVYDPTLRFASVALMLASTRAAAGVGSVWQAGQHLYTEAAPFATDHHVTTAAGAQLYIQANGSNEIEWAATGAVSGAADHTAMFTSAFAAMARMGIKKIKVGPGTWRAAYKTLPAGIVFDCTPNLTIFKPVSSDDRAIFTMDSGSATVFLDGPTFNHATISGAEATPTFNEQRHLITLHGVDGVTFNACKFVGWRGDALYIGSSDSFGDSGTNPERHNKNLHIKNCIFNGVNRQNRNAISCIDIDGCWITDNAFSQCTISGMPGPIDFEPNNQSWHIIKNLWVLRNTFDNCGGNAGTISVFCPSTIMATPVNVWVENNIQTNSQQTAGASFFRFQRPETVSRTSVDNHIRVRNNRASGSAGSCPLILDGVRGVISEGNTWDSCAGSGFIAVNGNVVDVKIKDKFIKCANDVRRVFQIGTVDGLDFTGSSFDRCSDNPSVGVGYLLRFVNGSGQNIKLNNIEINDPDSCLGRQIEVAAYTFDAATNQHFGCTWANLPMDFLAHQSDRLWTYYTPIIQGSTTAGTGSYSKVFARWRRTGLAVTYEIEIIQTSHTGTGMIEIQLPTVVSVNSASGLPDLKTVPISLDGVATTGGQIGLINPRQTINDLGKLRCYHSGTGTLQQTLVPTGAATYRSSGAYSMAA